MTSWFQQQVALRTKQNKDMKAKAKERATVAKKGIRANKQKQKQNQKPTSAKASKQIVRIRYVDDDTAKVRYTEKGRWYTIRSSTLPLDAKLSFWRARFNQADPNGELVRYVHSNDARINKCNILANRRLLPKIAEKDKIRKEANMDVYTSSAMPPVVGQQTVAMSI